MKKRKLTEEQQLECLRLRNIVVAKRASTGLTQAKLADALDVSQAAVSHYLNGVNPLNARVAAVFAQLLGVPVREFSERLAIQIDQMSAAASSGASSPANFEKEHSNVHMGIQPVLSYKYPVISWVAAGAWAEAVEPFPPGFSDAYETSDYKAKGVAFWLSVKGDSMTSPTGLSVPEGTLILVDTEADATPGKLVVAKLVDGNEATFKKLVEDAGQRFLKPLNPAYPMIAINGNCRIVGVAVRASLAL